VYKNERDGRAVVELKELLIEALPAPQSYKSAV
jgi:hypothetical protein